MHGSRQALLSIIISVALLSYATNGTADESRAIEPEIGAGDSVSVAAWRGDEQARLPESAILDAPAPRASTAPQESRKTDAPAPRSGEPEFVDAHEAPREVKSVRDWVPTEPTALGERPLQAAADEPALPSSDVVVQPVANWQEPLDEPLNLDKIQLERLYQEVNKEVPREEVRLTLQEIVQLALEENRDIEVFSYTPLKASAELFAARGEFDPLLGNQTMYLEAEQSASQEAALYGGISSIESRRLQSSTSLGGRLHYGTEYNVALDMTRDEVSYNNFREEWSGGLTLSITQPLLRGRGKVANLARVRAAKNAKASAEYQLRLQVMNTIAEVIRSYWDYVGAIEGLKVRQRALENAERLLDINEKRLELGTAAVLEVVQAKAGVAGRQSDYIAARSQMLDAETMLKNAMGVDRGEPLDTVRLLPANRPATVDVELDETSSIERALTYRPELQTALLGIDSATLELKRSGNDLLPQLDLGGSVFQGGRGNEKRAVFDGITERTDTSWTVNVQGSIPIRNRAARGSYQRAQFDLREQQERLDMAKQDLVMQTRLALNAVRTSQVLVEANEQSRAMQETNVDAEERRLKLGVSTSFEVLRTQEDLANAETQEVQAKINLEKSLVDLRLAEGVLLEELGLDWDAPEAPKPVSFVRSVFPPRPRVPEEDYDPGLPAAGAALPPAPMDEPATE